MGNNSTLDSGLLCLFFVLRVRLLLHFPCTDDDQTTTMHIHFLYFLLEKSEGQAYPFRGTSLGTTRTIYLQGVVYSLYYHVNLASINQSPSHYLKYIISKMLSTSSNHAPFLSNILHNGNRYTKLTQTILKIFCDMGLYWCSLRLPKLLWARKHSLVLSNHNSVMFPA